MTIACPRQITRPKKRMMLIMVTFPTLCVYQEISIRFMLWTDCGGEILENTVGAVIAAL